MSKNETMETAVTVGTITDAVAGLLRGAATNATAVKTHGPLIQAAFSGKQFKELAESLATTTAAHAAGDKRKAYMDRLQTNVLKLIKGEDGKAARLTFRTSDGKGEVLASFEVNGVNYKLVQKPATAEKVGPKGEEAANAAWQTIGADDDTALLAMYERVMARMTERGIKPPKASKPKASDPQSEIPTLLTGTNG